MKTKLLTLCFIFLSHTVFSQSLYFTPIETPLSGINLIKHENFYVVEQIKDDNDNWINSVKHYWESSAIKDLKKHASTSQWENNAWKEVLSNNDSIIIDNEGLISSAISIVSHNYPNNVSENKSRFTYTHNSNKTLRTLKLDKAPSGSDNAFINYSITTITYDNNKRNKDSVYYYDQQKAEIIHYVYDTSNQIEASYTIDDLSGDTVGRGFYTYNNSKLQTSYVEFFYRNANKWIVRNIDSLEYTEGRITKRTAYFLTLRDGEQLISPESSETYTYNLNGTLNSIYYKKWVFNSWVNMMKTEFTYESNNKLLLGLNYKSDGTRDGFKIFPESRYVFDYVANTPNIYLNETNTFIYPNPSNNVLNISLPEFKFGSYQIKDISGKTVLSETVTNNINPIPLTELCNGIYFITIEADGQTQTTRFVVAK